MLWARIRHCTAVLAVPPPATRAKYGSAAWSETSAALRYSFLIASSSVDIRSGRLSAVEHGAPVEPAGRSPASELPIPSRRESELI